MRCTQVAIDCNRIVDDASFHDTFAHALGFPDFYGRNMNAWVDCMTSIDAPDHGMSAVHAPAGGALVLELFGFQSLAGRQPELYRALVDCTAFVNWRRIAVGEAPVLILSARD